MILIIPILAILREIFDLSDATKPYALLLGEEVKEKNLNLRKMKNPISNLLLFIPIVWMGCDTLEDKKADSFSKAMRKWKKMTPNLRLGFMKRPLP